MSVGTRINPGLFVMLPFTFIELFILFLDLCIFLCLVLSKVSPELNSGRSNETVSGFRSPPSLGCSFKPSKIQSILLITGKATSKIFLVSAGPTDYNSRISGKVFLGGCGYIYRRHTGLYKNILTLCIWRNCLRLA